ncbi:ABC transporter ATP-binding protein [Kocuria sp. p3-SID1433]|uniref:dipeptide ABC transporter ATP-binding protein n=1 Tax=unclassified Kocuria TaxID=2649579 RepID=UPI0021A89A0E|nr:MULTISPECIES: ABC transporter ATP-binding protein [unclassified Kocuria]MCT1603035.1 ABC transporter ATP-binding protein [Kocuria sp. p3-SID1428]MCT2181249.1 ABC transporter ATP-binding protein [Kocuria sp. p3-SID1433]
MLHADADARLRRSGQTPLLEMKGVGITFKTGTGDVQAVADADIRVMPGETVAIVGESGSGKSTSALAAIGLLASNGRVSSGEIRFDGEDITHPSKQRLQALRGSQIGMVPQDPMSNLNPVWKIGFQVREALKANGKPHADADVVRALEEAGLPDAERRMNQYPHEFSGGMRQRALIAIGLSCRPQLLIADEPTSALDVTVQRQILDHLGRLTSELGTAVLLITHDLGLAAERADRVVVMQKGRVVESGPALKLLRDPQHPYTKELVAAVPSLHAAEDGRRNEGEADELIQVRDLVKEYRIRGSWGRSTAFRAVDQVSFDVRRGRTTAIVGESGSGKSTIAKMLLGLEDITEGTVTVDGKDISGFKGRQWFDYRRKVQPIFQDPYGSLDPMRSVFRCIEEPLRVHKVGTSAERREKVLDLLDRVALPRQLADRYPNELSGGQRQRVAIARALALDPEIVVCDEAVSALDVLVQEQVLQLLGRLQDDLGLTYLFITHDLAVVREIAHEVCVMERGKLVEAGSVDSVFENPQEEYTRRLLDAIPGKDLLEV